MKKLWYYLAVMVFLLSVLTGCGKAERAEPSETKQPESVMPAELTVSDLETTLSSLDLTKATIRSPDYNAEESYSAAKAIRAEQYLNTLRDFTWEPYQPPEGWEWSDENCCELSAPGITITVYRSDPDNACPLRLVTDRGEGVFTLPFLQNEEKHETVQVCWMASDALYEWYQEAFLASVYGGKGTPLTAEELNWFEAYTDSERTWYDETFGGYCTEATPISCFFTSFYDNPRDLKPEEFLQYCPSPKGPEVDEEEFRKVQKRADWRGFEDNHLLALEELPVPCHRLPRAYIDEILAEYAGITTAEMHSDWLKEALYIPETDCFYTFTSDFGPGMFFLRYGEAFGDTVTLWSSPDTDGSCIILKLQEQENHGWHILSYQTEKINRL